MAEVWDSQFDGFDEIGEQRVGGRRTDEKTVSPEEKAGLISRNLFLWIFPLLKLGYESRSLQHKDLYPIAKEDRAAASHRRLLCALQRPPGATGPPPLWRALFVAAGRPFWDSGAVLAVSTAAAIATPVVLMRLLDWAGEREAAAAAAAGGDGGGGGGGDARGYGLAVLLFLCAIFKSITEHRFWILGMRATARMQGATMAAVTRKALALSPGAQASYPAGQLTNLLGVDAWRVADTCLLPMLHWGTWGALLPFAAAWAALRRTLGAAATLAGFAVYVAACPAALAFGRRMKGESAAVQGLRDLRGRGCAAALAAHKVLKALQWELFAEKMITVQRNEELKHQWRRQLNTGLSDLSSQISMTLAPIVAFLYCSLVENQTLTAGEVFSALAWFNLLQMPLQSLPLTLAAAMDCAVSWGRLRDFFAQPEVAGGGGGVRGGGGGGGGGAREEDVEVPGSPIQHGELSRGMSNRALLRLDSQEAEEIELGALLPGEIELVDASFKWNESDQAPVLSNIDLHVRPGELVVVLGPVGCGKSSLIAALAGELVACPGTGRFSVHGSLAYAGQAAWVQNLTVAGNVRAGVSPSSSGGGPEEGDADGVGRALRAAALEDEVAPGTEVGDGGGNLSGGQRQRLALARAAYARRDIVLLDCALASLDNEVAARAWERCVAGPGAGSTAARGSTRVVATHRAGLARDPRVDRVVVLGPGGRVVGQGSFAALRAGGDPAVLAALGLAAAAAADEAEEKAGAEPRGRRGGAAGAAAAGGQQEEEKKADEPLAKERKLVVEEEQRGTGFLDWKSVLLYAKAFGGGLCLSSGLIVLFAAEQVMNVWKSLWLGTITDTTDGQDEKVEILGVGGLILCVVTALRVATMLYGSLVAAKGLHQKMLSAVLAAPCKFFDTNLQGRILNRFIGDTNSIDAIIPQLLSNLAKTTLYFVSIIIILIGLLPQMLLIALGLAIPYWKVANFYRWPARDLKRIEVAARSPLLAHFVEAAAGAPTLRAFGRAGDALRRHTRLADAFFQAWWLRWIANQWVTVWLEVIGCLFTLGCALLAAWAVGAGALTGGAAGVLLTYSVMVPNQLGWILKLYTMAEVEFVSVERIGQYISLKTEEEEQGNFYPEEDDGSSGPAKNKALSTEQLLGQLTFTNINFGYSSDMLILRDLNLSVAAGTKLAVLGATGAGKSSLFQILMRFYKFEGTLELDGVNIKNVPLAEYRKRLTYIPQHPILFGNTLREALTGPNDEALTDAEVWAALDRVGLRASLLAAPAAAAAAAGDDGGGRAPRRRGAPPPSGGAAGAAAAGGAAGGLLGAPLARWAPSAGERQLLCAARALLKPACVVLCDEMTASLDVETDNKIHKVVFSIPNTVVAISHRLHYLKNFDEIVFMEQGKITVQGSYEEIISKKPELFNQL